MPCYLLKLVDYKAPTPPAELPTCNFDIVQLAFAIIKENLLHLEGKHRHRPVESFDVMEYRRIFTTAFGFQGRREVRYSLETGQTAQWDKVFGHRWDVVVGGEYIVHKITFKREKIGRRFSVSEKLKCLVDLINVDCTSAGAEYRTFAHKRLMDKYRIKGPVPTTENELVPVDMQFTTTPAESNEEEPRPHHIECLCKCCLPNM